MFDRFKIITLLFSLSWIKGRKTIVVSGYQMTTNRKIIGGLSTVLCQFSWSHIIRLFFSCPVHTQRQTDRQTERENVTVSPSFVEYNTLQRCDRILYKLTDQTLAVGYVYADILLSTTCTGEF